MRIIVMIVVIKIAEVPVSGLVVESAAITVQEIAPVHVKRVVL